jgi:hypothetical protein
MNTWLESKWSWLMVFLAPLKLPLAFVLVAWAAASNLPSIIDSITSVLEQADALTQVALSSEVAGKINRIFPLSEMIGMLSLLGSLTLAAFGFKLARILIPGL